MKTTTSQLERAAQERQLVRFQRRFETSPIRGYVMRVGPRFFLLALVSDRLWFDGFECFRVEDIRNLRVDPYAAFAETALKARKERRPRTPPVGLASIEAILLSSSRAFPLVTISREEIDNEVCHIGRALKVERGRVSLLEISPAAKWDKRPKEYRVNEITRVNFGGDYEGALHLVGGDPPALEP